MHAIIAVERPGAEVAYTNELVAMFFSALAQDVVNLSDVIVFSRLTSISLLMFVSGHGATPRGNRRCGS